MKKMSGLFLTIISLLFSTISFAGILAEPYLGYNISGKSDQQTYTNSSGSYTYSNKFHGPQMGARLGYDVLGLMGGISFNHAFYTLKEENSGASTETDSKRNDIGIFIGYNAPLILRAWLGYLFSVKETVSASGDYKKGSAVELGFGYTALPFLSINLEIKSFTYTNNHSTISGMDTTYSPKLKTSELVLSVGTPFNFF